MTWGATSKAFHWLGAALILYLLIHGFWMVGLPREVRFGHYETHAAQAGHWGLYLLMLGSALSGWALAGTFGRPLDSVFGGFRVPALVSDRKLHGPLEDAHVWLSWALAFLVAAHVAAAFYHLLWRKDDVMQRMLR
jgi:cytochrome b561